MNNDFLVEIGTEELPAKGLEELSKAFKKYLQDGLEKINIPCGEFKAYVTPRRLAVLISHLADKQPDMLVERKGPATTAPAQAQEGFAKSCGVRVDQLTVQDNYLVHRYTQAGKSLAEFMPVLIEEALKKIPVGKTMRWGNHEDAFIRPIRWILMLHGNQIVPGTVFGIPAGNLTYSRRFLKENCPGGIKLPIDFPGNYESILESEGKVIADFEKRYDKIREELLKGGAYYPSIKDANPIGFQTLLKEVTGLVESPVVLEGKFDERFLNVPKEALIAAMTEHQKCFPVGKLGQLQPSFILVSNIDSTNSNTVIQGNKRVMRARLSDAEFFYITDRKRTLESRLDDLKAVTFQAKLGSLYEKSERISKLAEFIAPLLGANPETAKRAGLLCKADLTTGMVGEFPELQGIMGDYYAQHDKEPVEVARAIREHYYPRFATDNIPESAIGCAVSLADRIDTLVGIFGIGQQPTGDKDPFALRRSAVGILNILCNEEDCNIYNYDIDFKPLLEEAVKNYGDKIQSGNIVEQITQFILERMRAVYLSNGLSNSMFNAVAARVTTRPVDFRKRIEAVKTFSEMPQAAALAAANKRVSNLLLKEGQDTIQGEPNLAVFEQASEQALWNAIAAKQKLIQPLYQDKKYTEMLTLLADLQTPIDEFFNSVMVMAEDEKLRLNRLRLLNYLRQLFLQVADISLLQE